MEGTLFFIALAFITQDGVVPVFIYTFTGSLALVGVSASIRTLFLIAPKIMVAHKLSGIRNMPGFTAKVMLLTRPLFICMIPILIYIDRPEVIVWSFLMITMVFWGGHSLVSVTWNDVFSRTVDQSLRGKVHGYQQLLGGIAGLAVGYIIKRLLDSPMLTNEQSYMLIFGLCGVFMLLSSMMLIGAKDGQRESVTRQTTFLKHIKNYKRYFDGHSDFWKVTVVNGLSKVAIWSNPFIILSAKNILKVPDEFVTTLIYLQIAGTLAGGFIWGNISHRLGNKMVIIMSMGTSIAAAGLVCAGIFMKGNGAAGILIAAAVFIAGSNGTSWLGYLNYTLDIAGEEELIDLMILQSLVLLPLAAGGYLIGLMADTFGYVTVFAFAIGVTTIGLWYAFRLRSIRH